MMQGSAIGRLLARADASEFPYGGVTVFLKGPWCDGPDPWVETERRRSRRRESESPSRQDDGNKRPRSYDCRKSCPIGLPSARPQCTAWPPPMMIGLVTYSHSETADCSAGRRPGGVACCRICESCPSELSRAMTRSDSRTWGRMLGQICARLRSCTRGS